MVCRIKIADHHVAEASLFASDLIVFIENLLDGAGVVGEGRHQLADTFFDALGDHDLAFAGKQLNGAHFAHVHAYGVGGASGFCFHGGECRSGFCRGDVIGRAVAFGHQQFIGVRCHFEHLNTHVIDHLNDVFNLIRIGNILGQVVVDFGVGQVALILASGDKILEPGLLLGGVGHSADTFE